MTLLLLLALSASPDAGVAPKTFTRSTVHRVVRKHAPDLRVTVREYPFVLPSR